MARGAAFFDLDRTLMTGSSAYYFGKACYREGLLPLPRLLADGASGVRFRLFGASDERSEALRDRILSSVAGHEAETFHRLAPQVIEEILPRITPQAQALLDMHTEAGRAVWIVSASPVEIVAEIARALDLDGGLGTESEIVDGAYTGELAGPFCYGEGKAEVIRRLVAERGYDLQGSYAYSDSASDLPMMHLVGNPVAVNPDRPMLAVAHARGWPVVEFNRQSKRVLRLASAAAASTATAGAGYAIGRRQGRQRARAERLAAQPARLLRGG
ncbi:MAG: HAD family hydrolase [Actinomycetota bacterium]